MQLFFTLLPLYLVGNFHCLGMCGPLVMLLAKHQFRYFYFLGRLLSFSLAGLIAGSLGHLLAITSFPSLASLLFGSIFVVGGLLTIFEKPFPGSAAFQKRFAATSSRLSLLLLQDNAYATFLFGFATVFLPCGQSLLVFSACALAQDPLIGLVNGFAFAVLTSPSLFFAMQASNLLHRFKIRSHILTGYLSLLVGLLTLARSFADLGYINHLVLIPSLHVVLY